MAGRLRYFVMLAMGLSANTLIDAAPPGAGWILVAPQNAGITKTDEPIELPVTGRGFANDLTLNGPLTAWLEGLRSPDFAKRDQAMQVLLRLPPQRISDVQQALQEETDAEAAARLSEVVVHLYLKARTPLEGKASLMGIKLSFELTRLDPAKDDLQMTVAVAELEPGYPAAQTLHTGDRMIAMQGKRFRLDMGIDDFRAMVSACEPGSVVNFTVVREGKTMDVAVQMAGLPQAGPLGLSDVVEQRERVSQRLLANLKIGGKETRVVMPEPPETMPAPDDFQLTR